MAGMRSACIFPDSAVNKTVYRQVEVDGTVPFQEMELAAFPQTGNQAYETSFFADENGENYRFYLTAGRHTLALTARDGADPRGIRRASESGGGDERLGDGSDAAGRRGQR